MSLSKRYNPQTAEPRLEAYWQEHGVYHFDREAAGPVYSIDTPPPTVSGHLHLGHVYSYSHADFFARFWRMNGRRVFYPMGFDDNGLPTERLVERTLGIRATEIGREAFIEKCLAVSEEAEKDYRGWPNGRSSICIRRGWPTGKKHPPSGARNARRLSLRPIWMTWSKKPHFTPLISDWLMGCRCQ